jgi:hypothetical protein
MSKTRSATKQMRTIFVFLKAFQPTYSNPKIGRLISSSGEIRLSNVRSELRTALCLHAAMKSEALKFQNTDKPLTRMKKTDLPRVCDQQCVKIAHARSHTKRPHTSRHTAGIWTGSHHGRRVAQYPELSARNLGRLSFSSQINQGKCLQNRR